MTTSARREWARPASSSTLPDPISVAESAAGRDCTIRSTIAAPALRARSASSSSDASVVGGAPRDEGAARPFSSTLARIARSRFGPPIYASELSACAPAEGGAALADDVCIDAEELYECEDFSVTTVEMACL